jgi:RNA polymerase sigma factor (TIGR02999 family)
MNHVTQILNAIERGDRKASGDLLPLIYDELRKLAAQKLAHEPSGQTLQATALVHEAYVRLVGNSDGEQWDSRRHFFAAAAQAMRRILIENARRKQSLKRGGEWRRENLENIEPAALERDDELLALDEALQKLAVVDANKAELVQLRYFGGLTMQEAAKVLRVSVATAERHWSYAKAWLHCEITRDES